MLYLPQLCPFLAAAAGGAAAFADVATARGPHLRATGKAERCVGTAPLMGFDQLRRAPRRCWRVGPRFPFRIPVLYLRSLTGLLDRHRLGHLHRVGLIRYRGRVLPRELGSALARGQDAEVRALVVGQVIECEATED